MTPRYDFADEVEALINTVPAGDKGRAVSGLLGSVAAQMAVLCGGAHAAEVLYALADQVATDPRVARDA